MTTNDRVERLLRMSVHSKADADYLEAELQKEIASAELEKRVKDSIRLKHKLLELRQRRGSL